MSELWSFSAFMAASKASVSDWTGVMLLAVLSFVLGFALNRGTICTVVATEDLVIRSSPTRSLALLESTLWAGLVYAFLPAAPHLPHGWLPLAYLIPGTALFAIGSYLNGACVFGSIGQFGNGNIQFALAFVGIFIVAYVSPLAHLLPEASPLDLETPDNALLLFALLLLLLLGRRLTPPREEASYWRLGFTMSVVGLVFALLVTFTPLFSITTSIMTALKVPLAGGATVAGMFLGSMASGYLRGGPFTLKRPSWKGLAARLGGGMLMGLGALLIPGGNDTLLLAGLPGKAWQAGLSYVLLLVMLAALIRMFGSRTP